MEASSSVKSLRVTNVFKINISRTSIQIKISFLLHGTSRGTLCCVLTTLPFARHQNTMPDSAYSCCVATPRCVTILPTSSQTCDKIRSAETLQSVATRQLSRFFFFPLPLFYKEVLLCRDMTATLGLIESKGNM